MDIQVGELRVHDEVARVEKRIHLKGIRHDYAEIRPIFVHLVYSLSGVIWNGCLQWCYANHHDETRKNKQPGFRIPHFCYLFG
jgi:hypothetical protein